MDSRRSHGCHRPFAAAGLRPSRHGILSLSVPADGSRGRTRMRSTSGCGSLGAGDLALGACPFLRQRKGATWSSRHWQGRRGVTDSGTRSRREAARRGDENDGMSTSEGISQDNSVSNYYPDLSRVIQVLQSYPGICISHPNLSWVTRAYPNFGTQARIS